MKPLKYLALSLIVLACVQPVRAEIYEPGRGILLPRRGGVDKIPDNRSQQNRGVTVIERGQIAPQTQSPAVTRSPVRANDAEMTLAYASHLYTSVCAQDYREQLAPKTEPNIDVKKMWADAQASCRCLSGQVLSVVPATDLADYVMYTYSSSPPGALSAEKENYLNSGQSDRIGALVANGELRKKCGFLN